MKSSFKTKIDQQRANLPSKRRSAIREIELTKSGYTISPFSAHYTIEGVPTPLARPRLGHTHTYDSQKQIKYSAGIQLVQQHLGQPLFTGPLTLDVIFFMPIPERLRRQFKGQEQSNDLAYHPHHKKPDLDNLIKFVLDVANGTIITDDSLISTINARKVYSMIPRTEFSITRLEVK